MLLVTTLTCEHVCVFYSVKKQNEVCLAEIRNCEVERRMYCDQVNIEVRISNIVKISQA